MATTIHFNTGTTVTIGSSTYSVRGITRNEGAPFIHEICIGATRYTQEQVAAREGLKLSAVRRLAAMAIQAAAHTMVVA